VGQAGVTVGGDDDQVHFQSLRSFHNFLI
jgi:hypothetical protein